MNQAHRCDLRAPVWFVPKPPGTTLKGGPAAVPASLPTLIESLFERIDLLLFYVAKLDCVSLNHTFLSKSLTGEMPTQEALPLLLSKPDGYVLPASFGGHLSKSCPEQTPSSCFGQLPYLRAAGEDEEGREQPAHGSSRTQAWSSTQHVPCVPPVSKGGHNPLRPSAGPSEEEICKRKGPLAYSSGCHIFPPPPYPLPPQGPCLVGSHHHHHHHHHHLPALLKGSQRDEEEAKHCTNPSYCNNDMFFNLYPLR